ncbi:MAG: AAA family ATPase, partial [Mailhella sp.]
MRIISIRIRNLNSLIGDWTIRLDTPEYTSTGIFAITGPTGAGKSTILDAICLALYGSTPRLDKVTKTSNEIMSRQTADCLAEVRFRTSHGEYLCTWSQKRTGKKSASALQPPKHKLYDASGVALADSTKAVLAAVTELTGMDFPRFTQSMMLAQGHFASFLLADGDKRAPLLEKITGTAIYSEISRNVHERTREEMDKFKTIEAERAAQHLLTEEEEAALKIQYKEISEKTHELTLKEQNLQENMERLKAAEEIARESAALAEEKQRLLQEQSSFLSDEKKLDEAERAVLLSDKIASIHSKQKEIQIDTGRISSLRQQIEKMEVTENKERLSLKTATDDLEKAVRSVQKERELWNIVRKKDAEVEACRRSADEKKRALSQRFHERELCKTARQKALHKKRMAQENLSTLCEEKKCHAGDEYLSDALTSMESNMNLLEKENITFAKLQESI